MNIAATIAYFICAALFVGGGMMLCYEFDKKRKSLPQTRLPIKKSIETVVSDDTVTDIPRIISVSAVPLGIVLFIGGGLGYLLLIPYAF